MKNRFFIYRNITKSKDKHIYSMRSKADNKVKGHSSNFMLTDAKFRVGQAGRERVLREGVKNVHAGVEGTLTDKLIRGPWIPVKYNPKIDQGFIRKDTNEPVSTAKAVKFTPEGVFMKAAFWNGFNKLAEKETNKEMVESTLNVIEEKAHYLNKLMDEMASSKDAPPWVVSKISQAKAHIQDVVDYVAGDKNE